MEKKIEVLIQSIHKAFAGVRLGRGVSWREADVLDSYGSNEERKLARAKDEQRDWSKIPFSLIGAMQYQNVLPFLDTAGLKFYLPICMIYVLSNYKESQSLISDSLMYTLARASTINELKKALNESQISCVIDFLNICMEIGDDYLDIKDLPMALKSHWVE
ncbi:MAG: DUF6714 family protein [Bacteroidota bacterium]